MNRVQALKHLGPLVLFGALAIAWTWPLARHLTDAIPGDGGDNYSFIWNLWWMRHVLATPDLAFFRTTFLFHPFGTTIADHPHTALPGLVAATVFAHFSVVTAQNLLLLAYVFLAMTSTYALVWDITGHRRAAVFAGVIFGTSPYLAAHLLGHFDLVAVWLLPAFAFVWRRALRSGSAGTATVAGVIVVATAYTAYYYVVYEMLLAAVYLAAWIDPIAFATSRRTSASAARARRLLTGAALIFAATAVWIVVTGGATIAAGPIAISAREPQNVLTAMWIAIAGWSLARWRVRITPRAIRAEHWRRTIVLVAASALVFLIGAAPLIWQAGVLVARGEYVTPAYQWRSAPRGVDLAAPLLGPPRHPLTGGISRRAHAHFHLDPIEAVGWLGFVPIGLFVFGPAARATEEDRIWRIVAVAFGVWALGPFLTVAGFDTGLHLPEALLRFVPFVANARMPGRAIVGVFLAIAVLAGSRLSRVRRPGGQWLLVALVAFEFWDAPIPLTMLDRPPVYAALAASAPGAVCEAPFGIGDGLSSGVGSQDRRVLFYATQHEHPLVGGYIGRMPADAADRYRRNAFTAALLRLSGDDAPAVQTNGDAPPCRYVVVDRLTASAALHTYVARLNAEHIATDERRDLYQLR
jgi:hypothetical protein